MSKREQVNEERAPRSRGRPKRTAPPGRRKRVPLGVPDMKLDVPNVNDHPDYVYRWINDKPGRLQNAYNAGYEFVEDPTLEVGTGTVSGNAEHGSRVSRHVGKDEHGRPLHAFLMRIRKDWYDEDQAKKQAAIDEIDNAIRNGQLNEKTGDGRYIPKEGIKYK